MNTYRTFNAIDIRSHAIVQINSNTKNS